MVIPMITDDPTWFCWNLDLEKARHVPSRFRRELAQSVGEPAPVEVKDDLALHGGGVQRPDAEESEDRAPGGTGCREVHAEAGLPVVQRFRID